MTDSLAIGLLLPSTNLTVNLILSFKFTLLVVFDVNVNLVCILSFTYTLI